MSAPTVIFISESVTCDLNVPLDDYSMLQATKTLLSNTTWRKVQWRTVIIYVFSILTVGRSVDFDSISRGSVDSCSNEAVVDTDNISSHLNVSVIMLHVNISPSTCMLYICLSWTLVSNFRLKCCFSLSNSYMYNLTRFVMGLYDISYMSDGLYRCIM